ncbi:hypothetical protein RZS08_63395, partial [Arthrospira platensis SPKY1]|nr:hypothetical protein [Arthrospira platensis SPKY1]
MDCEDCTKKKNIHLTEIVDGEMTELHLCEDCPKLKNSHLNDQFGLSDLIAGMSDFGPSAKSTKQSEIECP